MNRFENQLHEETPPPTFRGADDRDTVLGEGITKGTGLLAVRDFALERYPDTWQVVQGKLSEQSTEVMASNPLPNAWYPLESYVELVEKLSQSAPGDDEGVARELGAWEVKRDFQGGVYRALLALTTPAMALRVSGALWGMYHRSGKLRGYATGPNSARVEITNFGARSKIFWAYVCGFIAELARMANAHNAECVSIEGGNDRVHYMTADVLWSED